MKEKAIYSANGIRPLLLKKNPYLLKMTAYIHLNPEKLNLTKDAKDYPYSSYQYYLYNDLAQQKGMGFMKAAIDEALNLLGNANYAEFVRGVSKEDGEFIHKKLQRGGILGSDEFVKAGEDRSRGLPGSRRRAEGRVHRRQSVPGFILCTAVYSLFCLQV